MTHELSQQEKENIAKEWIAAEAATRQAASAKRKKEKRKEYDDERKKNTAPLYVRLTTAADAKAARVLLKKMADFAKVSGRPFERVATDMIQFLDSQTQKKAEAAPRTDQSR